MTRARTLAVALVGAATLTLAYRAILAERDTVDDVFIYLRYARNLAERGEIAFSPGDRVEGASSVLWTLLLGAAWKLGLRGLGAAKALSFAFGMALPFACASAVRRAIPDRPLLAALPAIALALDGDLAFWSSSGMDTPAWALACVLPVALAASDRPRAAALALGILPWVRPEGPLLTAAGIAILSLASLRERADWRRAGALIALAAAPLVALTLMRVAYFHDVVPNTFYAKMRAVDGRDYTGAGYVLSALARRPALWSAAVAAVFASTLSRPPREGGLRASRSAVGIAVCLAGGIFLFALLAGGDWMPNRRLLVAAVPLGAVAVAIGAARVRPIATHALTALLFVEAALSTRRALDQRWRRDEYLDRRLASLAPAAPPFVTPYPLDWMPTHLLRTIAPYARPGDTVAHVDVGELPYVAGDVAILDGLGLVDREAARATFFANDPSRLAAARAAFFAKDPVAAIVVLDRATLRPVAPAQAAALADPRFAERYREVDRVPSWGDNPCVTFVRRDREAAPADAARARLDGWLATVPDVRPSL